MKKIEKIESKKFELSGAYYVVERVGQLDPKDGNDVVAQVTIFLPATGGSINPELRFGCRVQILEEKLDSHWGYVSSSSFRTRTDKINGERWSAVFERAAEIAEKEIMKLEDALRVRAQALLDAEE